MSHLTRQEFAAMRYTPWRTLGLFLTDRCPVGCAHCSVDSRRDSPTITNFELFESILTAICGQLHVSTVVITGGEPFVERRGLTLAVDRLAEAEKQIVLFTSGVWANTTCADWIRSVLRKVTLVFLSTDAFHYASIDDERFVRAARVIAEQDVWLIVQVLDVPEMVDKAEYLLQRAFGSEHQAYAEVNLIPPLPYGRATSMFARTTRTAGEVFGRCDIVGTPVVRYDGGTTVCCNEQVIMGWGPDRLYHKCTSGDEVIQLLDRFRSDPLLQVMKTVGVGALTSHPRFSNLAQQKFSSICELCWQIQKQALPIGDRSDRLILALELVGEGAQASRMAVEPAEQHA